MATAVTGQQTSKWEIVVHIMCTILVAHLVVIAISVIVVLTENKVQVKYYVMLSKKGEKKGLQYLNFYYNLSKRRKKNI